MFILSNYCVFFCFRSVTLIYRHFYSLHVMLFDACLMLLCASLFPSSSFRWLLLLDCLFQMSDIIFSIINLQLECVTRCHWVIFVLEIHWFLNWYWKRTKIKTINMSFAWTSVMVVSLVSLKSKQYYISFSLDYCLKWLNSRQIDG